MIPGLEDLSEDEKIACLAMGVYDTSVTLGMVKNKVESKSLTASGRVQFDRLLLKMKAVPPVDRFEKAIKATNLNVSETDRRKVAQTAHKILSMGIMEAFHDYVAFQARRKAGPEVGAGQPADTETPRNEE